MGELIRNLKEIRLGQDRFMLELNEGYSKSRGQIIHIQNKDFRYVLTEKDFLHLSAVILKAKDNMDYFKNKEIQTLESEKAEDIGPVENDLIETPTEVLSIAELFEKKGIQYRIIENRKGLTSLIVKPCDAKNAYQLLCNQKSATEVKHVLGTFFGYRFLYQMTPFKLFKVEDTYIEVFNQLPCMSLTPKTWIPLDKSVQAYIWNHQYRDENGCLSLDDITHYIYRLTWAIFKRQHFNGADLYFLEDNIDVLDDVNFKALMEKVFFNYTDELITELKNRNYGSIILNYYKFSNY